MSRSIWKGPFSEIKLPSVSRSTFNLKIWSRRSMILPIHLEKNFQIYNGKRFVRLKVSEDMIGHKFGEFALTRRRPIHKINKTRQVIKRKK
jgi:small subunit ribosomal protein S19